MRKQREMPGAKKRVVARVRPQAKSKNGKRQKKQKRSTRSEKVNYNPYVKGRQVPSRNLKALGSSTTITRSMNPRVPGIVPSIAPSAKALLQQGSMRINVSCPATSGQYTLIFASNVGTSGILATVVQYSATSTSPASMTSVTIPSLSKVNTAANLTLAPTSARAQKCGIQLVNITAAVNACGLVMAGNIPSRFEFPTNPAAMSGEQWEEIRKELVSSPMVKTYSGAQLLRRHEIIATMSDHATYESFREWDDIGGMSGPDVFNNWFKHIADWPGTAMSARPMTTIVIVLDAPTSAQTYNIAASGTFLCRWPIATVPGQMVHDIPLTSGQGLANLVAGAPDGLFPSDGGN